MLPEAVLSEAQAELLDWQGLGTLVIGKQIDPTLLEAIQIASRTFGIARCIVLDPLPMDPRHNAKIHYPALRNQLRKNQSID